MVVIPTFQLTSGNNLNLVQLASKIGKTLQFGHFATRLPTM
jgi:hypothetical protein